jgi:hypothetical protein
MVLLKKRPLDPEIVNQDEPVAGEREEIEDGRWKGTEGSLALDLSCG